MKTTGMVRRIDELGRIVIPKEIRKQLMMKEGESISFSLEDEKIILTKFSILNKMSPTIQVLLDGLYTKTQNTFLVCNKDYIIASSQDGLARFQRKTLSQDLKLMIQNQNKITEQMMDFVDGQYKVTVFPLIHTQEAIGAFIMLTNQTPYYMVESSLLEFVKDVIEQEIEACV